MLWKSGGNLEHLSGTFAVGSGDYRGMDVKETSALEKLMGSVSKTVPHSDDCSESVRASSQVCNLSQELKDN